MSNYFFNNYQIILSIIKLLFISYLNINFFFYLFFFLQVRCVVGGPLKIHFLHPRGRQQGATAPGWLSLKRRHLEHLGLLRRHRPQARLAVLALSTPASKRSTSQKESGPPGTPTPENRSLI